MSLDHRPSAGTLSPSLLDLMEHEKAIEQGIASFREAGWALERIRDDRKYRAAGFDTFEDYCRQRWDISRAQAYRLISAYATVAAIGQVSPIGDTLPSRESQVRPLTELANDPAAQAEAWQEAVDDAEGDQPTAAQVADAVERRREPQHLSKPDVGGGVSHPARFTDEILRVMGDLLRVYPRVLDPFAGTGRIHEIDRDTVGVELEPEWAACHERTQVGDATDLPFPDCEFDAIATSPCYGNRLADHHNATDPESRRSYTHDLGRPLSSGSAGALQWGTEYRDLHRRAWIEAVRVLRPGGRFVLNIKDHMRDGEWIDVTGWHVRELNTLGLRTMAIRPVSTSSLRSGANGALRAGAELVIALDKS
jgi:SAM-dependent methyltransferase